MNVAFSRASRESGFSLTEIMIGMAILAGVALAGATLFKNQSRAQARIEQDQMLSQYHSSLSKTLRNNFNCNATFKFKADATLVGGADDISMINLCNTSIGGNCVYPADISSIQPISFIQEGDWVDGGAASRQIWTLTKIEYKNNSSLTTTGSLPLRMTYTLNPKLGTRSVTRDTSVNLRFSSGKFKECFNDEESTIDNLQNDVCKSFSPLNSNGVVDGLVYWDDASQTCKLKGATTTGAAVVKDCSTIPGQIVNGIGSDGKVKCKTINFGAASSNADAIIDSTSCTISASSKVKLVWTGTKVKLDCQ
jgi:prepilin-type N-terminal cleavage/methylation domain-containing protein